MANLVLVRRTDMPETPSPYEQFRTLTVSVGVRMYERKLADAALFRLRAAQAQFKLDAAIGAAL